MIKSIHNISWEKFILIFTVRNEVAKVMFFHPSVILFTGGEYLGRYPPRTRYTPPDQVPPRPGTPPEDGYCCGRYASYWNAFLFRKPFVGGSLESPYWLHLAFCPKILGGGGYLGMVLCHSMNAGSLWGQSNPPKCKDNYLNFLYTQ